MKIIEIKGDNIYCYHDETFMVFIKPYVMRPDKKPVGTASVGYAWIPQGDKGEADARIQAIANGTTYHIMLLGTLIDYVAADLHRVHAPSFTVDGLLDIGKAK